MPGHEGPAPRRVVTWGTSVLTSALAAGLAHRTNLDVEQVEATLPAAHDALRRKQAHAVVCDLASVPAAGVLNLLAVHPHLVMVIVDPDAARALVLTCRQAPTRTIDDLAAALQNGDSVSDDLNPGPAELPT
jgi:hypothetical protein